MHRAFDKLLFLNFEGGGYAILKHTAQGVANAKFVLLPILSPFNCIITHLILYQIFNRPHGANRDVSRSLEPHLLVQGNVVISLPLRLSAPIFVAKSCFSRKAGA